MKSQSGFFTVKNDLDDSIVICQIRGRLRKGRRSSSLVAAGDRVEFDINADGSGTIENVAERERVLSRARSAPTHRKLSSDQEQVLVANLDQVVFVFSIRDPEPALRKLDRFLVVAEMNQIPATICVNKIDLSSIAEAERLFGIYEEIGYQLLFTSSKSGQGIDELREALRDKISVLAGSSGVGKSSLLNAIQPGLGLRVHTVSEATSKGLHTTRHVELIPLEVGGYVADTPGIRGLAIFDLEPGEMDGYYREIGPLASDCQFSDCRHSGEPGCAVKAAVDGGDVSPERYDSYLRLRAEHEKLDREAY